MIKYLANIALAVVLSASLQAGFWTKAVDRPIDASSKTAFNDCAEALRKDMHKDDFESLISSVTWIAFYEGTIASAGGRYDPELGIKRACAVIHGKSTRQVCAYAAKLTEAAPNILNAYKKWLADGAQ